MTLSATEAYLALGSNLGDRAANLAAAAAALHAPPSVKVVGRSSIYESPPAGPVADQPSYYNAVLAVAVTEPPRALLQRCLAVETALGRRRVIPQGPRTIDIDLLLFGDRVEAWPELVLPHPELARRVFVLRPLLELAPERRDPRTGQPLAAALEAIAARQPISKVQGSEWK